MMVVTLFQKLFNSDGRWRWLGGTLRLPCEWHSKVVSETNLNYMRLGLDVITVYDLSVSLEIGISLRIVSIIGYMYA